MACVPVEILVRAGLDPLFQQTWTLGQLAIGDLASSMSLAPGERLTLEVSSSQRQVVTRDVLDSAESVRAIENTVIDREAVNVVRSNTKTTNWHVDGTGTIAGTGWGVDLTAGFSKNVTDSNQTSINRLTETTRRSSETLKTLHKIEVKGTTETLVQNRVARVVRNPYRDRTLSLNVFQLIKKYTVASSLVETRTAIIVPITNLAFDDAFVLNNVDFLQQYLLDSALLDELPMALKADQPGKPPQAGSFDTAVLIANAALRFLFQSQNIFNVPVGDPAFNPNTVDTSFNASVPGTFDSTGLRDSIQADGDHAGRVFAIMNFFFRASTDETLFPPAAGLTGEMAIRFATALANQIEDEWKQVKKLDALFDLNQFTEIHRRIPGFLAMVKGMLLPLVEPAAAEQVALRDLQDQQQLLRRLLGHLDCNRNYYIQRFLRYVWEKTDGQAIVDFASEVLARIAFPDSPLLAAPAYDLDATFIDKQQIVVPGTRPLTPADIVAVARALDPAVPPSEPPVTLPVPNTTPVEIPADGIHLEVAQGACVLKDVPSQPFTEADIELGAQSFKVSQS